MSNMAVGIPIGLAMGIAIGVNQGKKRSTENLQQFLADRAVEMHDGQGRRIEVEELLAQMQACDEIKIDRRALFAMALLGLTALVGIAGYYLLK